MAQPEFDNRDSVIKVDLELTDPDKIHRGSKDLVRGDVVLKYERGCAEPPEPRPHHVIKVCLNFWGDAVYPPTHSRSGHLEQKGGEQVSRSLFSREIPIYSGCIGSRTKACLRIPFAVAFPPRDLPSSCQPRPSDRPVEEHGTFPGVYSLQAHLKVYGTQNPPTPHTAPAIHLKYRPADYFVTGSDRWNRTSTDIQIYTPTDVQIHTPTDIQIREPRRLSTLWSSFSRSIRRRATTESGWESTCPALRIIIKCACPFEVHLPNRLDVDVSVALQPASFMGDARIKAEHLTITPTFFSRMPCSDGMSDRQSKGTQRLPRRLCTMDGSNHGFSDAEGWRHTVVSGDAFRECLRPIWDRVVTKDDQEATHWLGIKISARFGVQVGGIRQRINLEETLNCFIYPPIKEEEVDRSNASLNCEYDYDYDLTAAAATHAVWLADLRGYARQAEFEQGTDISDIAGAEFTMSSEEMPPAYEEIVREKKG